MLDHNAVLESVDEGFKAEAHKYVDDMTIVEKIPSNAPWRAEFEPEPAKLYHASETQEDITTLKTTCTEKGLQINGKKTQLLAVSSNRVKTAAYVEEESEEIHSSKRLKLLGFTFSERPDVSAQVENIRYRAMLRFFVLRRFSEYMPGSDLKKLLSLIHI